MSDEIRQDFKLRLGQLIGAESYDISDRTVDILITLGKGIMWSREIHAIIAGVAAAIEQEFELTEEQGH